MAVCVLWLFSVGADSEDEDEEEDAVVVTTTHKAMSDDEEELDNSGKLNSLIHPFISMGGGGECALSFDFKHHSSPLIYTMIVIGNGNGAKEDEEERTLGTGAEEGASGQPSLDMFSFSPRCPHTHDINDT